jgi:hypothetical protein
MDLFRRSFLAYILHFIIFFLGINSGSMQSPLKELLWMQKRRKESVCHVYVNFRRHQLLDIYSLFSNHNSAIQPGELLNIARFRLEATCSRVFANDTIIFYFQKSNLNMSFLPSLPSPLLHPHPTSLLLHLLL